MNGPEVSIHLVTAANAWLLDRVDVDVFDNKIQPALLRAFLANPANALVVAVADDEVIGMASGIAYIHPDKPLQLFVNEIGVSARFRRQGIGKRLLTALLLRGRELGCHDAWVATEQSNAAAQALYSSAGGNEENERAIVYVYSLVDDSATAKPGNTFQQTLEDPPR